MYTDPVPFLTKQALSMQHSHSEDATQRNMSDTIWNSLRMAVSMMEGGSDLVEHARHRNLDGLRQHFGVH